jgi:hypothetical protein
VSFVTMVERFPDPNRKFRLAYRLSLLYDPGPTFFFSAVLGILTPKLDDRTVG